MQVRCFGKGKNGGTTWETSHQCCIMRKVICKEVVAGGMFDFFLDSVHVTWLPSFKALKMQKQLAKYTFPAISEDLSFKMSQGTPLANLHLGTGPFYSYKELYRFNRCFIPRQSAQISLEET